MSENGVQNFEMAEQSAVFTMVLYGRSTIEETDFRKPTILN
jgi:hypothetical protein